MKQTANAGRYDWGAILPPLDKPVTMCFVVGITHLVIRKKLICSIILLANLGLTVSVHSQTATIADAWWTFQQDCDADGCRAGTLPANQARLNWEPNANNCSGIVTVIEKIYSKPCASNTWTLLLTNGPHVITGCSLDDRQFVDLPLDADCVCRDYKIEIFRNGQVSPDYIRSATNDVDLNDHFEELLAQESCDPDLFSACWILTGTSGTQLGNNPTATKELAEPDHAGNAGGKSLWYCWTATTNTPVTFDTQGSSFDTLLAVYVGNNISNLSLIVSNDDIAGANNRQSRVTFAPTNGTTYHIALDGYFGASGSTVLTWQQSGAALPDLIIWGGSVAPEISTQTFAANSCEVLEGCAVAGTRKLLRFANETRNIGAGDLIIGNPAGNPLFHYASCHGHYHFEQFALYRLRDIAGNIVADGAKVGFCLEDVARWSPAARPTARYNCGNQGIQSGWADIYSAPLPCQYIDITGIPGGNYILEMEVDPTDIIPESNETNNLVQIAVTIPTNCVSAPPNNHFVNATTLTNPPVSISQLTACANKEAGEPNHAGFPGGHSIWYQWTPSATGTAVISTEGSHFDTLLGVYTGTTVSALTLVASNDDITPGVLVESRLSFTANAGTVYRIALDGYGGEVGQAVLNLNPPGNNNFPARYTIAGIFGSTNGTTIGASKESYEPAHAANIGGHSVWYLWTAPTNGPVEFNTLGSSFDTTLAIYTGTALTNLVNLAGDNDSGSNMTSRLTFNATTGIAYRIAVDGFAGASGSLALNWNMLSSLAAAATNQNQVELTLWGVHGQRYQIQTSPDLLNWTPLTTLTISGGSQHFPDDADATQQFYRAVLVP